MRAWIARIRDHTLSLPRPSDDPHVHAQGPDPDRILLIGSGPAVGWGVLSFDLSLGGVLARAVSAQTGRGADVDIVARAGMTAESVVKNIANIKMWRYDVVVLCLGLNESMDLTALGKWRTNAQAALKLIVESAAATAEVFVLGVPPVSTLPVNVGLFSRIAQKHADKLDAVMAEACELHPSVSFFPLVSDQLPTLTDVPGRAEYQAWGTELAERMAPVLEFSRVDGGRDPRLDLGFDSELTRQGEVESLTDSLSASSEALQRVVSLAKELFNTEIAIFSVLDGDRQRHVARVGLGASEVPRTSSFCAHTIQQRGIMIVPDALEDERFDHNPLVLGEPHIRFYAGYPIEGPSGEPIGALCVIDSHPRPVEQVDQGLLRRIALLIQAELVTSRGSMGQIGTISRSLGLVSRGRMDW